MAHKADTAWSAAVKRSVLLRKLPPETQGYAFRACKLLKTDVGQTLYAEGDAPDAFFVIQSGQYEAAVLATDGVTMQRVRVFGAADTVGSHALMHDSTHMETVKVLEAGAVWSLPRKIFDAKVKIAPAPPPSLVARVARVSFFDGLSGEDLLLLTRTVSEVKLEKGQMLYRQGDDAASIYFLEEGQLKQVVDNAVDSKVIVKAPQVLGLSALYSDQASNVYEADATAWAGTAHLMRFSVADIEALVGFAPQMRALRELNVRMLSRVQIHGTPITDGLGIEARDWLGSMLVHEPPFAPGATIAAEGSADEKLYVIWRGVASVTTEALGEVGALGESQFFGELALTGRKHKRTTTVRVREGSVPARVMSLPIALVRTNPELASWVTRLDELAEKAARTASQQKAVKSVYAQGRRPSDPKLQMAQPLKRTSFTEQMAVDKRNDAAEERKVARVATKTHGKAPIQATALPLELAKVATPLPRSASGDTHVCRRAAQPRSTPSIPKLATGISRALASRASSAGSARATSRKKAAEAPRTTPRKKSSAEPVFKRSEPHARPLPAAEAETAETAETAEVAAAEVVTAEVVTAEVVAAEVEMVEVETAAPSRGSFLKRFSSSGRSLLQRAIERMSSRGSRGSTSRVRGSQASSVASYTSRRSDESDRRSVDQEDSHAPKLGGTFRRSFRDYL